MKKILTILLLCCATASVAQYRVNNVGGTNVRTILLGDVYFRCNFPENDSALYYLGLLGSDFKIANQYIPALAISDIYVKSSLAQMLALSAENGDVCIRTDSSITYILSDTPASNYSNWKKILTPSSYVQSVNGDTGPNVTLTTDNVSEGSTVKYWQRSAQALTSDGVIGSTNNKKISIKVKDTVTVECDTNGRVSLKNSTVEDVLKISNRYSASTLKLGIGGGGIASANYPFIDFGNGSKFYATTSGTMFFSGTGAVGITAPVIWGNVTSPSVGRGFYFSTAQDGYSVSGHTHTSGLVSVLTAGSYSNNSTFKPTSGNGQMYCFEANLRVDQSVGTATGSSGGMIINPPTIYAADWRGVDFNNNNTGHNIYASGTAKNLFGGFLELGDTTTKQIISWGTGSPEGVVTASPGSFYLNKSGGAGVTLYIKESGTGNTGWVAK